MQSEDALQTETKRELKPWLATALFIYNGRCSCEQVCKVRLSLYWLLYMEE